MLKNRLLLIVLFALLVAGTQLARYTPSPNQPLNTPTSVTATQTPQPAVGEFCKGLNPPPILNKLCNRLTKTAKAICKFKAAGA